MGAGWALGDERGAHPVSAVDVCAVVDFCEHPLAEEAEIGGRVWGHFSVLSR